MNRDKHTLLAVLRLFSAQDFKPNTELARPLWIKSYLEIKDPKVDATKKLKSSFQAILDSRAHPPWLEGYLKHSDTNPRLVDSNRIAAEKVFCRDDGGNRLETCQKSWLMDESDPFKDKFMQEYNDLRPQNKACTAFCKPEWLESGEGNPYDSKDPCYNFYLDCIEYKPQV